MTFRSLILKNLTRRSARSALTLVALATAITAVVALFGIAQGFTRSFSEVYSAHGIDLVVSRQGTADRLSSSVDLKFIERIEKLQGIQRVDGVLLDTLSLEDEGIYGIPTMGIQPGSWLMENYTIVQGKNTSSEGHNVLLGVHLAERIGKSAGETITLFDEAYTIDAVFQSSSTWENGSMILPLSTLQQLTDRAGQVTYINVVLESAARTPAQMQSVVSSIQSLDRRLLALKTEEYVATDTRMQIAHAMAWMTSAIALLIGTIGTLNTMLTSVLERTKEIGILRAIGWPRRRVVAMIMGESCVLAVTASVIGFAFAVLLTRALSQSPSARGLITPHIDVRVVVQGFALALIIGLLGALIPAIRAARLSPTEAFREN